MKSFADWTSDLAAANNAPKIADKGVLGMTWDDWILNGAVDIGEADSMEALCQGCGEWTEIHCEAHEFDPAYHYCGGSPRCCP